jgi:hypothetical protein
MNWAARRPARTSSACRDANEPPAESESDPRSSAWYTKAISASSASLCNCRRFSGAVSKIEHGEISGIDVVRAYVAALGGSVDVVARLGDRGWKVA